jgi:hypothetical protein
MGMTPVILTGVPALVSTEQTWQRSQAGALVRTGFGEREAND